jgi:hypothetical protein
MTPYSAVLSKRRLASTTFILACLLAAAIGMWASTHQWSSFAKPQEIEPRVTNTTKSLHVVSIKKVGKGISSDIEVTLLNQSSRNIAAYMISIGEVSMTTLSFPFEPGQTRVERIPFSSLESNAAKTPGQAGELVLSAVYLEGGVGEGDTQHLKYLTSRMVGIKEQAGLVLPILRRALNSLQASSANVLDAIESETTLLPIEDENAQTPPQKKGGRNWVKGKLRRELQDLKNKHKNIARYDLHTGLKELTASYEQLVATL